MASEPPWPVTVTKTGSTTSASAGMSTVKTEVAACQARALTRSCGHVAGEAALGVGDGHLLGGDADGRIDLDVEVLAGQRSVVVEPLEPLERREPPDLLAPGRDGVVGQVEGAHRVKVGGDLQAH